MTEVQHKYLLSLELCVMQIRESLQVLNSELCRLRSIGITTESLEYQICQLNDLLNFKMLSITYNTEETFEYDLKLSQNCNTGYVYFRSGDYKNKITLSLPSNLDKSYIEEIFSSNLIYLVLDNANMIDYLNSEYRDYIIKLIRRIEKYFINSTNKINKISKENL